MIKNIVIAGGGFTGYLTGLLIKYAFGTDLWPDLKITIIESSKIGTIGVGETTAQDFPIILGKIGIDPFKFMKAANGTFKLAGRFDNWNYEGESFYHELNFLSILFQLIQKEQPPNYHEFYNPYKELSIDTLCYLAKKESKCMGLGNLCLENKLPFIKIDGNYQIQQIEEGPNRGPKMVGADFSPFLGMHMDANSSIDFLKEVCKEREIPIIDSKIVDWTLHTDTGNLTELILDTGQKVKGDFFFDCTGFKRLIIGKIFKEEWRDFSKWIPENSCSLIDGGVKYKEGEEPNVVSIVNAQKYGWMFEIPLIHRKGSGYIYSDRFVDKETIHRRQREYWNNLGHDVEIGPQLSWSAGKYKRSWIKNCIAVGLSEGFLEPLDGPGLITHIGGLQDILFPMFHPAMEFEELDINGYNKQINEVFDHIRDFVCYCHLAKRKDSEYWRYFKEDDNMPDSLKNKIRAYANRPPRGYERFHHPAMVFGLGSWATIGKHSGVIDCHNAQRDLENFKLEKIGELIYQDCQKIKEEVAEKAVTHKEMLDFVYNR